MIYGVGTDLLRVARIHSAFEVRGIRLLSEFLGEREMVIFNRRLERNRERGLLFLATRFAAKEALSKAIGLGMRQPMSWRMAEFVNASTGKPTVELNEPLKSWCIERGLSFHVSMTDGERIWCVRLWWRRL